MPEYPDWNKYFSVILCYALLIVILGTTRTRLSTIMSFPTKFVFLILFITPIWSLAFIVSNRKDLSIRECHFEFVLTYPLDFVLVIKSKARTWPFLWGLSLEGLIFGGTYVRREVCVSKLIGLACGGKEIYHFCFVLLCIRGQIPSTSRPEGLYSEERFNGGFFALRFSGAYIWRGLHMEGLIFGILR